MGMTVQDLIDRLSLIKDKSNPVYFEDMKVTDVCEFEDNVLLQNDGIMED